MSNTVSRVILQQLVSTPNLEKNGSVLMLPIKLSNVQMINLYNKHENLRKIVNKDVRARYKISYEIDTFIYPNLGINIINKTEEQLKCSQRQDDISTILNRKVIVEKDDTHLKFILNIQDYYEELKVSANKPFLDKLIEDLCIDNDVLMESIKNPEIHGGSISFEYEDDIWRVSAKRLKHNINSKIGDILSNLLVSDKIDSTVLQELYQQVVVKILKLKYYNASLVNSHFQNDAHIEDLIDIRAELERHLVTSSVISSFLSIHKELLFVLSNTKGRKYKALTEVPEFQYFILVLVDTLVRSFISKNTSTSFYDRGGYSRIIDDVFFEGLRDNRHPGRLQILQFISNMLESLDFDIIHMNMNDIQMTIQRFHGVNLSDTNTTRATATKLRAERDKLSNELKIINKYILVCYDICENMKKVQEFLRHFSEGRDRGNDISLRYIVKSIKSGNLSINIKALDEISVYIDKFLSEQLISKMLREFLYIKGIFQKGSKEWHELRENLYTSSFKAIMLKGEELASFDNKIKSEDSISLANFQQFLVTIENIKKFFINEASENKKKPFEYIEQNNSIIVKQKGAASKALLEHVDKIQEFLDYFNNCDNKIEANLKLLESKKDSKTNSGFISFLFKVFDSRINTLTQTIKKLELATGKKSKANIDSFYKMVKRIKTFYKITHLTRNPLSNKPVLLPNISIPPTYIQTIKNIVNSYGDLYLETIFGNDEQIEHTSFTSFQEKISEFYSEVEVTDKDKETLDKCLKNYFQAKQEQIKEEKLIAMDNDFKMPKRLEEQNSG
jgi:sulfur relay (sulfurtransferase) DsrC/TusE family protein